MTLDVTKMCAAKSDQINAIDLISGPRIAKITDVKIFSETEQPIHVVLDGDTKRPWKCSKTSVRALASLWTNDASKWVGKHIEIYCDETVLWGGQAVGGIRQSKAEGITSPKRLMLTKSRTKKETVVINPLSAEDIAAHYASVGEVGVKPPKKPNLAAVTVDPTELKRQMDAVSGDAAKKREWWSGLTDDEKAVVKGLAAEKEAGDE